jgi:Phage integrase family
MVTYSSDADLPQGLNASLVIFDEVNVQPNDRRGNAHDEPMGARESRSCSGTRHRVATRTASRPGRHALDGAYDQHGRVLWRTRSGGGPPNVDFSTCRVSIRGTLTRRDQELIVTEPKSGRARVVLLTPIAVAALNQHRVIQAGRRRRAGSSWADLDFVFTNELGRPLDASNVRLRSFRPALERAGLPRIRFHDLRHTAATLMLGQGVHPKVVSEMLGHSQIGITLDLYSHVTPTMQESAVQALEALLGGS